MRQTLSVLSVWITLKQGRQGNNKYILHSFCCLVSGTSGSVAKITSGLVSASLESFWTLLWDFLNLRKGCWDSALPCLNNILQPAAPCSPGGWHHVWGPLPSWSRKGRHVPHLSFTCSWLNNALCSHVVKIHPAHRPTQAIPPLTTPGPPRCLCVCHCFYSVWCQEGM